MIAFRYYNAVLKGMALFAFVASMSSAAAQSLNSFVEYKSENGITSNNINAILQGQEGFLWLGTDFGLARFDGYEFVSYTHNSNDSTTVADNFVYSLYEDSKGGLWAATIQSIDYFDKAKGEFKHYYIQYDGKEFSLSSKKNADITLAVAFESDSLVWVCSASHNAILRCNLSTGKVQSFGTEGKDYYMSSNFARAIAKDQEGYVWIGTRDKGLFRVNTKTFEIKNYQHDPDDPHTISSNLITAIFVDAKGHVWAGTYGQGLNRYVPEEDEFIRIKYEIYGDPVGANFIFSISGNQDSIIVLGTDNGGVNIFNKNTGRLDVLKHIEDEELSLSGNIIRDVYFDNNQNLWAGTFQHGIAFSRFNNVKPFSNEINGQLNLQNHIVTCILETGTGEIWFGTDGEGIFVFDPKTNSQKRILEEIHYPPNVPKSAVMKLYEDRDGDIWIGTYHGGAFCFNPRNQRIKQYTFENPLASVVDRNDIRNITQDNTGRMWLSSKGGGVYLLDKITGEYSILSSKESGYSLDSNYLVNAWPSVLMTDQFGEVWIGTYDGLSKYNPHTKRISSYVNLPDNDFSINSNGILAIARIDTHQVWIGTDKGLAYAWLDGGHLEVKEQFLLKDGLPNETIQSITVDAKGNLWLATGSGLSRFNPKTRKFRNYKLQDGLPSNNFTIGSNEMTDNGAVLLGTVHGYLIFEPDRIKDDSSLPSVLFTGLSIYNEKIEVGQEIHGRVILEKELFVTDEIVLKHNEDEITIDYVGIHFQTPMQNRFKYRLLGFSEHWTEVDANRRFATYTSLPHGTYEFQVLAANADGYWTADPKSLFITILPPYWKTFWFRLLVFLFAISALYYLYKFRVKQLNSKRLLLEKLVAEKTEELQSKNDILIEQAEALNRQTEELASQAEQLQDTNEQLHASNKTKDRFFSIIAHDLKNPFGALMGMAELLKNQVDTLDSEKRGRYADIIFKSARNIYNLLENLLFWSRSQTKKLEYRPLPILLTDLINENLTLQLDYAKGKDITLKNKVKRNITVLADEDMLNTIVRNLLSNAIKFTPNEGKITIEALESHGEVLISFKDTGIGIPPEVQSKLFQFDESITRPGTNGESGTGLGLMLCKEFVNMHHGQMWVESELEKGSSFHFTLPKSESI